MRDTRATTEWAPRVCYLLKRFPRLSQTFILNELLELERQGVDVVVVARRGSGEALTHERLAELRAPVRYLGDAKTDRQMADVVSETGATHVHAHFATWAADAAMRINALTGIPYSFTAHARDIHHEGVDEAALVARISRAAFVVTVSDANRDHLAALLRAHGAEGRVIRLYNGMDLTSLRPASEGRDPGLVVSVGRLVEKKGFADLIEACRLLRDGGREVRCAIVGEGELRAELQEQIVGAGLADVVSLPGARPQRDTLATIASGAVLALPCVVAADGDRDGLPTVILEAMALGTPVVSTDLPGVPEMIVDGVSGRVVPQRDPARLAAALGDLLDAPGDRRRFAERALADVHTRFDLATNVAELAVHFGCRPRQ